MLQENRPNADSTLKAQDGIFHSVKYGTLFP